MTRILPLSPLNIVVFPGEKISLHIFEPRYKQLILDCLENNSTFGMPLLFNNLITEYGTELKLISIDKTLKGGELEIKAQGSRVFKIKEFYNQLPNRLYSGGDVKQAEDMQDENPVTKALLKEQLQTFARQFISKAFFFHFPITLKHIISGISWV